MTKKSRFIGRKCVVQTMNFVLALVEVAFLIINRNTHRKINTIYTSVAL